MTVASAHERAWRTAKCRMRAEARFRAYDRAAHVFICYYSFLLIAAAIFAPELSTCVPYFDKLNITLSVLVFALSLMLSGYKWSETADKHRACYLALHKLQARVGDDISSDYADLLELYPNHAPMDDSDLIVESARRNNPVKDGVSGQPIMPTTVEAAWYWARKFLFASLYLLVVAGPFVALWSIVQLRGT